MAAITSPATGRTQRRGWLRRQKTQQAIFALIIFVPMVASFLLFWVYPFLGGIWGGFTLWKAFDPEQPFVGLRHYRALMNDPIFLKSMKNTFVFALMYLPAAIILSLTLALAIEATLRQVRSFFRMVYFLPVVTSTVATALIWNWLYQPSLGLFNQILTLMGLPTLSYLRSPDQALASIVVYALWKNVGFNMVLFIAGLSSIDRTYYDAAKVDGANRRQIFWHITLPLLQPTMVFVIVTGVISTLQIFGPVYIMSAGGDGLPGGPAYSTMVVSVYQWLMAFRELDLGYGSAMGVVLFVIILILTLAQVRLLRTNWNY